MAAAYEREQPSFVGAPESHIAEIAMRSCVLTESCRVPNLITPSGRTREPHLRDDRDAGHEPRPAPSPARPVGSTTAQRFIRPGHRPPGDSLTAYEQESVDFGVGLLIERGPTLPFPYIHRSNGPGSAKCGNYACSIGEAPS
jgi:hypothetical protein